MSEIKKVKLENIHHNPHRMIESYPWIEKKVQSLQHSIEDIGMWESIIVRPVPKGYQMAFGHHRLEAAKRAGLKTIPVIVKDLTDEEMLKYMGRENGEDYSTEFLIMLNTWEGAVQFFSGGKKDFQPIDIARVLGWTVVAERKNTQHEVMNYVAITCANAEKLVTGGWMQREELSGISVRVAKDVVGRATSRMAAIDKAAPKTGATKQQVTAAKKHIAKGAKATVKKVVSGELAAGKAASNVDVAAHKSAVQSKAKKSPLLGVFAQGLADSISKMLDTDSTADKLNEVASVVGKLTMTEDATALRKIDFELGEVANRATAWQKRLIPDTEKIVNLIDSKGGK